MDTAGTADTAGTEHVKDNQNTFELATKALGDCTYSMRTQRGQSESAGINRLGVGNERVLQ